MKYATRFAALVVILALAGCGPHPRASVKGKVMVAGKGPLTGGAIQFVLDSDPTMIGGGVIHADGSYDVVDAPVGECKVLIDNEHLQTGGKMQGAMVPGYLSKDGGGKGPPAGATSKMGTSPKGLEVPPGTGEPVGATGLKYMKINHEFAVADRTPLKATVNRGDNTGVNFEVK